MFDRNAARHAPTYGPFCLAEYPCALCHSSKTGVIMTKAGRATGTSFDVVRCSGCKHVYVNPRIADADLSALYDEGYYRGEGFDENVDYATAPTEWTLRENEDIIATISEALGRPFVSVRWLDVGCGTGRLVEAARAAGAEAVGFDESAAALRACATRGLPVLGLEDINDSTGTFDVVSAIQVIEHVADPVGFVRFLSSLVRVGGIIYIHTENWNVVRHLPGTGYVMPEGHIQYFTPQAMRTLLKHCDLVEVPVFNRVWFVWRRLPVSLRKLVSPRARGICYKLLLKFLAGYATFPVARRVR